MMTTDPQSTVRLLKGAPLSIVMILLMNGNAATPAGTLEMWTGYADRSISKGIVLLTSLGLLLHSSRGYRLAEGVQMSLFGGQGALPEMSQWSTQNREIHDNREFHDSLIPTTTINNTNESGSSSSSSPEIVNFTIPQAEEPSYPQIAHSSVDNLPLPVDNLDEPVDNFAENDDGSSKTEDPAPSKAAMAPAVGEALRLEGVGEPRRSQLARLPGLTPAIVHGLARELRRRKGPKYSVGLLIHALEAGEQPPGQAPGEAQSDDDTRSRYTRGRYAAFVEH